MRKRKLLVGLSVVLAITACGCNVEDFIPDSYGASDGNYLYIGNGRTTTTGENFEMLVSEIQEDGYTYKVSSCLDYGYSGDNAALLLAAYRTEPTSYAATPMAKGEALPDDSQELRYIYKYFLVGYHLHTKKTTL